MRRALLPPLLALALLAGASGLVAAAPGREHRTAHYDLYVEGGLDAAETGAMLEALHARLRRFFGAAPDGRLRFEIYATQERFLSALVREGQPYESGGGLYGPTFRKVWLALQPSLAYTRQLILHEATHQFHFLVATGNRFPSALWYTEGFAEFMGMANWDGSRLEVGVVPAITLEDYPDRARERFEEIGWDLAAALEDRVPLGPAASWALVHFLHNREAGRFRELGRRLERREPPARAVYDVYGEIGPRFAAELRGWLERNRQPWRWLWDAWNERGEWIEGTSERVAVSTLKETPERLEVELQPVAGSFEGGVVFGYRGPDDFWTMTVRDDRTLRLARRQGRRWIPVSRTGIDPARGRDVLAVVQGERGVELWANGALVRVVDAPGLVGLTVESCTARFRPTTGPARGVMEARAGRSPAG